MEDEKLEHEICVAGIDSEGLLGLDFLHKFNFVIDASQHKLQIGSMTVGGAEIQQKPIVCRVAVSETVVIPPDSDLVTMERYMGVYQLSHWDL